MASVPNGVEKPAPRSNQETHFLSKEAVWRQFQRYVVALRPWSFTASFTPVALGSTLAYKTSEEFSLSVFIITCLTALSVHAAGNLVNTYFDYVRGIDKKVNSDDRTLVDMILTPDDVATLGGVFYIFGCVGFFILTLISPARMEHLALIYFGGLSSSFLYTGGLGLKYIALGDILIMFTFGPLTVIFSYLSQTGYLSLVPMLYAFPLALNTEAILHCNNTRDMVSDKKAGIVTLAILLGKTGSYLLYVVLVFAPYTIFCLMGIHCSKWMFLPVLTIFMAFSEDRKFRQGIYSPKNTAKLNLFLGLLYILGCILSDRLAFRTLL
ncbi:ubiA prenyltransferase domain-containing protein 1 homolog [Pecten maximus]|uniref:ubiA prenyltransferase domain-containing protein 1 homolog n=1 Tax=Pecten maximus TaxID=6579 RepID=UPI001459055B|nr:ubiA prenyltransferase domain-containing protein 1 homolog [Pecten maximus]